MSVGGSGGPGDDQPPTIKVTRRRQSAEEPGGRERADAPERQRESGGGGGAPPPTGGAPGGGGRPLSPLAIGVLLLLFLCIAPLWLMFGNKGGSQNTTPAANVQTQSSQSGAGARPTVAAAAASGAAKPAAPSAGKPSAAGTGKPAASSAGAAAAAGAGKPTASAAGGGQAQTWTIMLYQDADDKVLEKDIYLDLNEAERVGSSPNVNIVAQIDRFRGGFNGDGDWTGARRYYVTQDNDLNEVHSQQLADLGEVNMSDPKTLIDFVTWTVKNYPADKYVLILSDHGMGWPGGMSDAATGSFSANRGDSGVPLADALGNFMYLNQIDDALGKIRAATGIDKFELVGMDACLMAHLEVLDALAPHARYAVVSQETEPALGWAYAGFLGALEQNPGMTGADLSKTIVASYIDDDLRITDDSARTEWVGRSPGGAKALAQQMGRSVTLTAADLSALPALVKAVDNLAVQLQKAPQQAVAKARAYAQSFTSVFGSDVPASYIDLGNFTDLAKQFTRDGNVAAAADGVRTALSQVVIGEKHGQDKPGASGVSIYFPNSDLFRSPVAGPPSYQPISQRFSQDSAWPQFLLFHYTGRKFQAAGGAPAGQPQNVRAPGAGQITISPIRASGKVAAPGQPVTLKADVAGANIGYIYFFTGYYDKKANSIFVADNDYLQSPNTRQVGGVYYPDWGTQKFTVEFDWEPLMYAIDDGRHRVTAALNPQSYGADPADAIYTVDGIYQSADGSDSRRARLYFRDGQLRQVFGFTGQDATGSPWEITPQKGDTFTVLDKWYDLDSQGNVQQVSSQQGKTLTFGDQPFRWREQDAAAGEYVVGFIVEDLDGNQTPVYTGVTVR